MKPEESDRLVGAGNTLLSLLPKLGAALVGISALSYMVGRRETQTYFTDIGAPWFVSIVPASRLIQDSFGLMMAMGIFAFMSVLGLLEKTSTAKSLRRWSIIWAIVAMACFLAADLPEKLVTPSTVRVIALFTGIFWSISAGLTIGELVAELSESKLRWERYHFWLIYFIFVFGLQQAPSAMGSARAAIDINPNASQLPIAVANGTADTSWRLVTLIDGKALLVRLAVEPKERVFRLLASTDAYDIRPAK